MSYPMSPPPQQQQASPHQMGNHFPSPYSNAASPTAQSPYNGQPPNKRPRLSPDPRSPTNGTAQQQPQQHYSPNMPHSVGTNGTYNNPYAQHAPSPQQQYSPGLYASPSAQQNSFNTPQPFQSPQIPWSQQQQVHPSGPAAPNRTPQAGSPLNSAQMMPPPPRPNKDEREEKVDPNGLNDTLWGSGINLKDEENYMHSMWSNRHGSDSSFASNQTNSFGSSALPTEQTFASVVQGSQSFGGDGGANGALAGTLGESRSQEDIESEQKHKREKAARDQAERHQHHLNNPFLLGDPVRRKLHQLAYVEGVKLDVTGVFERRDSKPATPAPTAKVMVDARGQTGVAAVDTPMSPSVVNGDSLMVPILSLISLATGERIRGLLDDAYGIARARRYGDHGRVVPPEFADIAVGEGKRKEESVVPESITGTQWDRTIVSPAIATAPVTDTAAANIVNGDATAEASISGNDSQQSHPTISFQGNLHTHLRAIADRDRQAEQARVQRRLARKRKAEGGADPLSSGPDTGVSTPTAETTTGPKLLTKKELNKRNKESAAATEAQAISTANSTAAMAFGMGKKKKYKWMEGGAATMPTNRFAKPPGAATPGADGVANASSGANGTTGPEGVLGESSKKEKDKREKEKMVKWGEWREDGVNGKGVQLRDWLYCLERDGKERKALLKAGLLLK